LDYGKWTGGDVNLTSMSLDQVHSLGLSMRTPENRALYGNGKGSSALGRYQITGSTLRDLQKTMGLKGTELFDAQMQDRMAMQLMQRRGADVGGLRNEWEGLRRVPGDDILGAYNQQMSSLGKGLTNSAALDPNMQQRWQQQVTQAQDSLALASGQMAGMAHSFTNDLSASLNGITSGAQSAGSGFGGALGGALQSIVGSFGGTAGSIISPLIGAIFGGFDKGGYTGPVGTGDVAGVVHGQEYVVNAQSTRKHRKLLDMINYGNPRGGSAPGVKMDAMNRNAPNEVDGTKVVNISQVNNYNVPGVKEMVRSRNQMAAKGASSLGRARRVG
jgi:hypothetical protein